MDTWDLKQLDWTPHSPEILFSSAEGRAIVLDLPAGERLQDHQVHEGAWIILIYGEVNVTTDATALDVQPGLLVHFAPGERREVKARTDTRLLLLLTPWPGAGHPGAMTLQQKTGVRHRAAERS